MRITSYFVGILLVSYCLKGIGKSFISTYQMGDREKIAQFDTNKLLIDLQRAEWSYFVDERKSTATKSMYQQKREDVNDLMKEYTFVDDQDFSQTIAVGRRWEIMGQPELNLKNVWIQLRFFVPEDLEGYQIGFFCTAVDDAAHFFLNGKYLDSKNYNWGMRIPDPVNVDLTPQVKFGEQNILRIRVSDYTPARGGGILGNVFLYRTLPYKRGEAGSIIVSEKTVQKYSVVLHLGDALLSQGGRTSFSASQLADIQVPPYILREDELILIAPESVSEAAPYRVELSHVSSTFDNSILSISCEEVPDMVDQYELITLPISLRAKYRNPFDSKQVKAKAFFKTPSGKIEGVYAFFQQNFTTVDIRNEEEILLPKAGNPWKLYYRPGEVGTYSFQLIVQDSSGMKKSEEMTFEVKASSNRGFLKVSKKDPSFFEFDNGESYFGIGPSGWARDSNYVFGGNPRWISTRLMDEFYEDKAAAGSNFDYFLAEFFGRLYIKGGFIDQHVAWKCEHRVRTLERLGIYWVTCYDDLRRSTGYGLNTLPYSKIQGGPVKSIEELYFGERALEMQKEHLRYFVSRMSDSPALLLWAIGDEGQSGNSFSTSMVRAWIKGLHDYVKSIDVYEHPHVIGEGLNSIADGGDAVIIHDWYFKTDQDEVHLTMDIMERYQDLLGKLPLINPEGGMVEWTKPEDSLGPKSHGYYLTAERWKFPEAISFHNHLWISLFTKNAVGGTEWLGHAIWKKNELYHATAIHNFLKGESLTEPQWKTNTAITSNDNLLGFALESDSKSWVWVWNKNYGWLKAGHYGKNAPTISGAKVDIPVVKNGDYSIELWDTRKGLILSSSKLSSENGVITYELPPISKDVALKAVSLN